MITRAPAGRVFWAVAAAGWAVAAAGWAVAAAGWAVAAAGYTLDPAASRLEFVGTQAGAQFKGVFHKFNATVDFSPEALAHAHFDVQIDLNSLDSMDKERDRTLRSADFFDVPHFATAHYITRSVTKTTAGYSALGALTLRGVTKDVSIDFRFLPTPGGGKLEGSAMLKRLDFGVGQGEWKSTEWVDDLVHINFSLRLSAKI